MTCRRGGPAQLPAAAAAPAEGVAAAPAVAAVSVAALPAPPPPQLLPQLSPLSSLAGTIAVASISLTHLLLLSETRAAAVAALLPLILIPPPTVHQSVAGLIDLLSEVPTLRQSAAVAPTTVALMT